MIEPVSNPKKSYGELKTKNFFAGSKILCIFANEIKLIITKNLNEMKRYLIELNAKFVAEFNTIKGAENKFNALREKYNGNDNMLYVLDTETDTYYKGFPLNEENEYTGE